MTHDETPSLLPLSAATFHVLIALADGERHGYAILQEVASRTGGEVRLGAATLYRTLQRMLEQGLVVETDERPDPALDDERRRYYSITPLGAQAARAEAARLSRLVGLARRSGLAPRKV